MSHSLCVSRIEVTHFSNSNVAVVHAGIAEYVLVV